MPTTPSLLLLAIALAGCGAVVEDAPTCADVCARVAELGCAVTPAPPSCTDRCTAIASAIPLEVMTCMASAESCSDFDGC